MADTSHGVMQSSLTGRVVAGWKDRRGTTRWLLENGRGESEALFFVMFASFIAFVAGIPAAINGVRLAAEGPLDVPGVVTSWMLTSLMFMVLARYVLSMLSRWGAKSLGGTGTHLGARYAQFWTALVVSPILFFPGGMHLAALITTSDMLYGIAQGMDLGAQIIFLAFWAEALAESEGFESRWPAIAAIFGPLVVLFVLASAAIWLLGGI
ncbi:MAG: hypothetical protein AAFQ36_03680 [Pseudomonadota bacterium]